METNLQMEIEKDLTTQMEIEKDLPKETQKGHCLYKDGQMEDRPLIPICGQDNLPCVVGRHQTTHLLPLQSLKFFHYGRLLLFFQYKPSLRQKLKTARFVDSLLNSL
jgi:hypothetical protein